MYVCAARSEFPEDASSYVRHMWDELLAPVMEGVTRLPILSQLQVLTAVVTSVCSAWTSVFLKEKTRFR